MNTSIGSTYVSTSETTRRQGTLYRCQGNLFVCKTTSRTIPTNFINSSRSSVSRFTAGSATRMRRYLRSCVADYCNMVTLTYPGFFESDGAKVKEHLRRYLQEQKRRIEREGHNELGYSSFWFLEFQERGAPHFHIFTTHEFPKQWVSSTWYRIVNSEDPRHLAAGTRIEKLHAGRAGTISYAQKYAVKQQQKDVPDGYDSVGRFWGVSGHRATMSADTFVSRDARKDAGVAHSEKSLGIEINKLVHDGKATVYLRDHGVAVYILLRAEAYRRIMLKVSILSGKTMLIPQLFQDAELDIER